MDNSDSGDRGSPPVSVIGVDRGDEAGREDPQQAEPAGLAEPARPADQQTPPVNPAGHDEVDRPVRPFEPPPQPAAPSIPQTTQPHKPVFSPGPASPSASPEARSLPGDERQPTTAWHSAQPRPASLTLRPREAQPAQPPQSPSEFAPAAPGPDAPLPAQPDEPAAPLTNPSADTAASLQLLEQYQLAARPLQPEPPAAAPAHPSSDAAPTVRPPEQGQPSGPPPPAPAPAGPGAPGAPPGEAHSTTRPALSSPSAQPTAVAPAPPGQGSPAPSGTKQEPSAAPGIPAAKAPEGEGGGLETRKRGSIARRRAGGRDLADPQTRFLALALVLEEAGIPSYVRTIILTLTGLVLTGIVWAAITNVDEVAVAAGDVAPAGSVKVVQHLEGGIVSKILVRDGDLVRSGDVLIRLETAQTLAELSQVRAREAGLILQARRLQAFVTGKPPKPLKQSELAKFRSLAADQLAILKLQELARSKQRNLLKSREASIRRRLVLVKETFNMRKRLLKRGAVSRRDFLEASRELEKVRGELAEVGARQTELDARLRSDALKERGKVTAELAQLRERLLKLRDRVRRLEIRAPTRGYVKGLAVTTEGGVIRPGQKLMEVVPTDRELIVEVRISTRDVGHIKVGQKAKVKFDTYDFARYGAIVGQLTKVSATTFKDDKDVPYYKGTIKLDKAYLGQARLGNRIQSGMTVQAEIVTGSKTILQYLLKPVSGAIDTAFRER